MPKLPPNGTCDSCGEKSKEGLYECPTCGKHVCADRCCAGARTQCFECENKSNE